MSIRNTATEWGSVAKLLHWLVFFLIVAALVAVNLHETFPKGSDERAFWMMLHKSFGVSIFLLVLVRLVWRASNVTPAADPAPQWQLLASKAVHAGLYLVLIAMPLSAALASQFAGRPIPFFGLFEIAPFLAENKDMAGVMMGLHKGVFAPLLILLVLGHVAAALYHHVVTKDNTLRRMF